MQQPTPHYFKIVKSKNFLMNGCNILRNQSYFYTNTIVYNIFIIKTSLMLHLKSKHLLIALLLIGIGFSAMAWQKSGNTKTADKYNNQDTVPSKNRHKIKRDEDKRDDEKRSG